MPPRGSSIPRAAKRSPASAPCPKPGSSCSPRCCLPIRWSSSVRKLRGRRRTRSGARPARRSPRGPPRSLADALERDRECLDLQATGTARYGHGKSLRAIDIQGSCPCPSGHDGHIEVDHTAQHLTFWRQRILGQTAMVVPSPPFPPGPRPGDGPALQERWGARRWRRARPTSAPCPTPNERCSSIARRASDLAVRRSRRRRRYSRWVRNQPLPATEEAGRSGRSSPTPPSPTRPSRSVSCRRSARAGPVRNDAACQAAPGRPARSCSCTPDRGRSVAAPALGAGKGHYDRALIGLKKTGARLRRGLAHPAPFGDHPGRRVGRPLHAFASPNGSNGSDGSRAAKDSMPAAQATRCRCERPLFVVRWNDRSLGRSQVLPYLSGLAERGHRIRIVSLESPTPSPATRTWCGASARRPGSPGRRYPTGPACRSCRACSTCRTEAHTAERLHAESPADLGPASVRICRDWWDWGSSGNSACPCCTTCAPSGRTSA